MPWNHRMVWLRRDLKDHLIPTPLPWAGTPFTRPSHKITRHNTLGLLYLRMTCSRYLGIRTLHDSRDQLPTLSCPLTASPSSSPVLCQVLHRNSALQGQLDWSSLWQSCDIHSSNTTFLFCTAFLSEKWCVGVGCRSNCSRFLHFRPLWEHWFQTFRNPYWNTEFLSLSLKTRHEMSSCCGSWEILGRYKKCCSTLFVCLGSADSLSLSICYFTILFNLKMPSGIEKNLRKFSQKTGMQGIIFPSYVSLDK